LPADRALQPRWARALSNGLRDKRVLPPHVHRPPRQRGGEDEPLTGSAEHAAEGVVGGVAGDVEEDFHSTPPEG
jgi:hypothetical protein